jgi:hypothetical protein
VRLSSSPTSVEVAPEKPKARRQRVGRRRKLSKRVEPKPDGRYLIYYRPL